MANTVTTKVEVDGSRFGVYTINITGDGSGEETNTVVLDCSALSSANYFHRIEKIESTLSGFSARLSYDLTTDVVIANINDGYSKIHGPMTNTHAAGDTGDVLLTTVGLGAGEKGTIRIWAIKSNRGA